MGLVVLALVVMVALLALAWWKRGPLLARLVPTPGPPTVTPTGD